MMLLNVILSPLKNKKVPYIFLKLCTYFLIYQYIKNINIDHSDVFIVLKYKKKKPSL